MSDPTSTLASEVLLLRRALHRRDDRIAELESALRDLEIDAGEFSASLERARSVLLGKGSR